MTPMERCPGCGASFPHEEGPAHCYMIGSAACWRHYGAVLVQEYHAPSLVQATLIDAGYILAGGGLMILSHCLL